MVATTYKHLLCMFYEPLEVSGWGFVMSRLTQGHLCLGKRLADLIKHELKLTSIELVMPSSHLILCHPLVLLPPIPPSIRVFSNESTLCMRWPKYWSFSFGIIPSKEHPGLISFRMDWLDLLAVQETLKSLLQLLLLLLLSRFSHVRLCATP